MHLLWRSLEETRICAQSFQENKKREEKKTNEKGKDSSHLGILHACQYLSVIRNDGRKISVWKSLCAKRYAIVPDREAKAWE